MALAKKSLGTPALWHRLKNRLKHLYFKSVWPQNIYEHDSYELWWTHNCLLLKEDRAFSVAGPTLKNKRFKTMFLQWCHRRISVPKEPFSEQFIKEPFWRTFKKSKEPFWTIKNLFCIWTVPWMLKVLHGTIDAKEEALFWRMKIVE